MPARSSARPRFASAACSESRWSMAAPAMTPRGELSWSSARARWAERRWSLDQTPSPIARRATAVSRRASRAASSTGFRAGAPPTTLSQKPSSSRTNASP